MSCFIFPSSFCKDLESLVGRYWWGKSNLQRGIRWCAWKGLCAPKELGGLGFRDFSKMNIALMAKQDWHLLTNPDSLVAHVLKAKYHPSSSFMEASLGNNSSYLWRSLWACKGLLNMGCSRLVGDGLPFPF